MTVVIDGESLSLEQVVCVARCSEPVSISEAAIERMRQSRLKVERVLARGDAVYGMTTGLGQLKRHRVAPPEVAEFNRRLIDSHLIGHGPRVPDELVRGTMLRLANGFAQGTVGVRPMLAQRLVDALNAGQHPPVRLLGSAGQADLARTRLDGGLRARRMVHPRGCGTREASALRTIRAATTTPDEGVVAGAVVGHSPDRVR